MMKQYVTSEYRLSLWSKCGKTCQACSVTLPESSFHVHHILPNDDNGEDNLMVLCNRCHRRIHGEMYKAKHGVSGKKRIGVAIYLDKKDIINMKVNALKSNQSLSIFVTKIIEKYLNNNYTGKEAA